MSNDPAIKDLSRIDGPEAFHQALSVSRETIDRLVVYETLLRKWQKTINLVSATTLNDVWRRHFADSAQLAELEPEAINWIDLGSGAGFPGLVIAILIMDRPGARVHLVESDLRKSAFLREVARQTGAPVDIHAKRIETEGLAAKLGACDIVTARALSPLTQLLEFARPFLDLGAKGLFLKGKRAEIELKAARAAWTMTAQTRRSRTDPSARIILVERMEPA